MAKPNTHRRRKKAFQHGVAYAVSVARTGDIDLTLFAGRRSVTRTLKASEAKLLAHLLTQKRSQSDGLESAHGWVPYTPSGAFRRRVVRSHQDNPMDLGAPPSLSAVTAGKCQTPLCEGSCVSSPRLSDSVAQSVCSGCGALVVLGDEVVGAATATIAEARSAGQHVLAEPALDCEQEILHQLHQKLVQLVCALADAGIADELPARPWRGDQMLQILSASIERLNESRCGCVIRTELLP